MHKVLAIIGLSVVATVFLLAINMQQSFADQRDFRLHNDSDVTITRIYVSPSDTNAWEDDVLDGDVVEPGDYTDITFTRADDPGACIFDIRVDGVGGARGYLWGVNLCRTTDVTFD